MKVFYSWQSDTPNAIGRRFIRVALDAAVEILAQAESLSVEDRPTIDQDTDGVLGAPAIAETILEKIRESDVVALDVTLVGETANKKKLLNSNVACELGYALGHHDHTVLLLIMNTFYGPPAELPFDLQHRRWPVTYTLDPEASREERTAVKASLSAELSSVLAKYISAPVSLPSHVRIPSTLNAATFWNEGEILVPRNASPFDRNPQPLSVPHDRPLVFLHLSPTTPLPDLSGAELNRFEKTFVPPLFGGAGSNYVRNKFGSIAYRRVDDDIAACTQVFKNREIWGIAGYILGRRTAEGEYYIPTTAFERGLIEGLRSFASAASKKFDYGERANVRFGIVNVDNLVLVVGSNPTAFAGPLVDTVEIERTVDIDSQEGIDSFLLTCFEAVFDAVGRSRPQGLNGFPKVA